MLRPEGDEPGPRRPRRVAVVTGSRAEFGLLVPVMRAIEEHPGLELLVIAAGSHLIPPALTFREVRARFPVADSVPMQVAGRRTRLDDAEAVGRGIARLTRSFRALEPDWVVVLGDRIEAFAAASAASIGGIAVAHLHGGDRAEGIADEAMRHAITRLAHLHLPATPTSAERIIRAGERSAHIVTIGSPAIDELATIPAMNDKAYAKLGGPSAVFMLHPIGRHDEEEELTAAEAIAGTHDAVKKLFGADASILLMAPNQDPGRAGIVRAIEHASNEHPGWSTREHLPRPEFIALLKRLSQADPRGVLVGNSSAGLIEAAALGLPVVDLGPRQGGRERPANVLHLDLPDPDLTMREAVAHAVERAAAVRPDPRVHPYGDGRAGVRAAAALASVDPRSPALLRKRLAY
jgi:UDP-hydrolysing UDP-N-acetyl-D-glucosamine 2-epimerase